MTVNGAVVEADWADAIALASEDQIARAQTIETSLVLHEGGPNRSKDRPLHLAGEVWVTKAAWKGR